MSHLPITIPTDQLRTFCELWQLQELAVFGSILRDDFSDDSDIDLLVTFEGEPHFTFRDWLQMERELAALWGRDVDLIDKETLVASPNYIRRQRILESAEVIYVR